VRVDCWLRSGLLATMAFQTSVLPVRTVREERKNFADLRYVEHCGSDHRDVAFGIECDVGALEGSRHKDAEHAAVESAEGAGAADITVLSGAVCLAKGMFFPFSQGSHHR
jgi:hypothetical protein